MSVSFYFDNLEGCLYKYVDRMMSFQIIVILILFNVCDLTGSVSVARS